MKTKLFLYFAMMLMWQNAFAISIQVPSGQWLNFYCYSYDFHAVVTYYNNNPGYPYNWQHAPSGDLIIPSTITYNYCTYTVTEIDHDAFRDCEYLTSVTIPNTVTNIGARAFQNCSELITVTIPTSVTSVGEGAFRFCTSLTFIPIPNSVTSIGSNTFRGCTGLTSVTIPNSIVTIGDSAFRGCTNLTSVTIPNSVSSIGRASFGNCGSLTLVTIPNSVTSIGQAAFEHCSSLTSVTIPNSVTSIGSFTFYYCSSLASVTIPNSVTTIGVNAFSYCSNLISVSIPDSVISIDEGAFIACSGLTALTIPNSVSSIGKNAFGYCGHLTTVAFNADSCTQAGGLNLANDIVPPFYNCPNLTSFTFGDNVKVIPSYLCSGLSSLTSITCNAVIPPTVTNAYAFYNVSRSIPLRVPVASVSSYQSAPVWNEFTNCIGIGGYTITATSANPTMGTVSGGGSYAAGATATLTATPNMGYHFVQWQDGNTQNPRTITVTGDATYTATFVPDAAPATVTATISQIAATSAYAEIVMGQQTSYFYLIYAPQSVFTQNGLTTDEAIISYINQHYGSSDRNYNNVSGYMNDLTPNTTYQLVVVPYNSNGEVGMVCWEQFTTLNETDPATVTATISEVTATSAYAEIVMGQQTSYFYLIYAPQSVFTQNGLTTDEAIINYVNQNYGSSDRNHNNVSGYMNDLTPNTTYMLVVVPYNSNDEVGTVCKKQFTTLNNNGIEDVGEEEYAISSQGGRLTVSGAEGNMVNVYSLDGRCIYSASAKGTTVIDIPASGTYLVKIGRHPARKVVVIR